MLEAQLYQKSRVKYRHFCLWAPKLEHLKCLVSSQLIGRSFWKSGLGKNREKLPNLRTPSVKKISSLWVILEQLTYPSHPQMLLGGLNDHEYPLRLGSDTKLLPSWHLTYHVPSLVGILALKLRGLCQNCWHNPKLEWCGRQGGVWGGISLNQSFS